MDIKRLKWWSFIFIITLSLISNNQIDGLQCYTCVYSSSSSSSQDGAIIGDDDIGSRFCKSGQSLPDSVGFFKLGGVTPNGSKVEESSACVEIIITENSGDSGGGGEGIMSNVLLRFGWADEDDNSTQTTAGSSCRNDSYGNWKAKEPGSTMMPSPLSRLVTYIMSNLTLKLSDNASVSGCLCREDECNNKLSLPTTLVSDDETLNWRLVTFGLRELLFLSFVLVAAILLIRCCFKRDNVSLNRSPVRYYTLENKSGF